MLDTDFDTDARISYSQVGKSKGVGGSKNGRKS